MEDKLLELSNQLNECLKNITKVFEKLVKTIDKVFKEYLKSKDKQKYKMVKTLIKHYEQPYINVKAKARSTI